MIRKYDIKTRDAKYNLLKHNIDSFGNDTKLIIFSEAKDTVYYLKEKLNRDYGDVVIDFGGGDSMSKNSIFNVISTHILTQKV